MMESYVLAKPNEDGHTDYSFDNFKLLNNIPQAIPLRHLFSEWQVWKSLTSQANIRYAIESLEHEPPPF